MTKSATINVRVNPEDKRNAEIILEKYIMIDQMSDVQLQERIQRGLDDVKHNRLHDIASLYD